MDPGHRALQLVSIYTYTQRCTFAPQNYHSRRPHNRRGELFFPVFSFLFSHVVPFPLPFPPSALSRQIVFDALRFATKTASLVTVVLEKVFFVIVWCGAEQFWGDAPWIFDN